MDESSTEITLEYIPNAKVEPVVSVKESDTLERAVTLMQLRNFSQLPVIRGKGTKPLGVVSWRSIANAMLADPNAELKQCIDKSVQSFDLSTPLLDVIPHITGSSDIRWG